MSASLTRPCTSGICWEPAQQQCSHRKHSRLVVRANTEGGQPGLLSKPLAKPAAPKPQLKPLARPPPPAPAGPPQLPARPAPAGSAPSTSGQPAAPSAGPSSNGSNGAPQPSRPMQPPPRPELRPMPGSQPPAAARPGTSGGLAPPPSLARPGQPQAPPSLQRPGSPAAPGQPQQLPLARPGAPPSSSSSSVSSSNGLASKPMPQNPATAGGSGLAAKPMLQRAAPPQLPTLPRPSAAPQDSGLAPKPGMPQPQRPALAPRPMGPPPNMLELRRPPQPQAGSSGQAMQSVELRKPEAPPIGKLEEQFQDARGGGARAPRDFDRGGARDGEPATKQTLRGGLVEVVEEDAAVVDDEDQELMDGLVAKGSKVKAKKGRKEKVTAEMKRKAREERQAVRAEKAAKERKDKEEIFEVGEEGMYLEELADALQVDSSELVRTLFMKGIMLSTNSVLDKNTVKLVAQEYDVLVVDKDEVGVTDAAKQNKERFMDEDDIDELMSRPPVVTVMGHVDHGKTSLLDYIRKAKVAAGEAGGITQAIGAYNCEVEVDGDSRTICFLDTPGHEAFSAMRARGARVTDVAIIIVAADDGVQPQTKEAVSHAQAADVPIIVAINKIDKPGADIDRTKQSLLELNLVPEEWGGNTVMVPISAKKGTGVDDLLTQITWVAEEQKLMANPKRLAAGTVIEAHLDKKKGPVATLLVQTGTLRMGDAVCAGASAGRVRTLSNAAGVTMAEAGPSIAVQLVGLDSTPGAGEEWQVYKSEGDARKAAERFAEGLRAQRMADMTGGGSMITLSSLATYDEDVEALQRLNLIIKGDTSGVVEAIKGALSTLPQQSVVLRYLLSAAGDISISDIDLAAASGGMVLGFNVEPDEAVQSHAKRLGVSINTYKIIYELIDDVKAAMEGKLRQVEERVAVGTAEVKAVFGAGKRRVAGCLVTDGRMMKGQLISVKRGKAVVHEGTLASLRRVKDVVDEVQNGLECGLGAEGWTEWAEGDVIECYQLVAKSRRLEDARATSVADASVFA